MNHFATPKRKPAFFLATLALLFSTCNWTTTRELLDLTFLDKIARKFQITSPALIESGTPFNVVVLYTDTNGGKSAGRFADYLTWEVVGAGSLTQTAPGTITSGIYQTTLIYSNTALTTGQSATIVIKAIDPNNSSVNGITGSVTAKFPISLSTFKFSTPTLAYQTTGFSVTISAIGTDSSVMSSYNGTVNLTPTVTGMTTPDGTLTPATATFTNGVATVTNVQYTKPAGSLYLNATDSVDAAKTGKSNPIQIAGDAFSLGAIPVDVNSNGTMDAIRVSWTIPQNAFVYKVYRETTPGAYTLTNTIFAPTTSGVDNDAALTLGTSYTYKVEARDSVGNLLKEAMTTVQFKNCTAMDTSMTVDTTFLLNNSPYCLTGVTNATLSNALTPIKLTIDPGVVLLFGANRQLIIGQNGSLKSEGTATLPITYTSSAYTPTAPAWQGIVVQSLATANNLTVGTLGNEAISETKGTNGTSLGYSIFEFAYTAVNSVRPIYIENSIFRQNGNNDCGNVPAGILISMANNTEWAVVKANSFVANQHTGCGLGAADLILQNQGRAYIKLNTSMNAYSNTNGPGASMALGSPSGNSTFYGNSYFNSLSNCCSGSGITISTASTNQQIIKNNYFFNNRGSGGACGGAIIVDNGSSNQIIQNNTFDTGFAFQGGAICTQSNNHNISYNIFKATTSKSHGGAIYLAGGTGITVYSNVFINTVSNTAAGGGDGGAIYLSGSNNTNNISNNSIYGSYSSGAGGANGGAIYLGNASTGVVIGFNNIKDTWATNNAGAIFIAGTTTSTLTISHNTFNNNRKGSALGALNSLYNAEDTDYTVSNNWWGSDYSLTTACQAVVANLCETTQANKPTLVGNRTALEGAWPLCCAAPSDPNCVGATTLPTGQACN